MINYLRSVGSDLLNLFFPVVCPACAVAGLPAGLKICLRCQANLPFTNFHLLEENPFTERFWGRLPIAHGAAMLTFSKRGRVQKLLHALKYKGRKDIGVYLGRAYGHMLVQAPAYRENALILPVPLHPRRLRTRGYNQSACFAQGLSETLGVPWSEKYLSRSAHTATQTRKSRIERFSNVEAAFRLHHSEELAGKQVLLVDDVLTTGATMEACGQLLIQVPDLRLNLATIAIAAG